MSPRRNYRRPERAGFDEERARRGVERVQQWTDGEWTVRYQPPGSSDKTYRCPGCDQLIPGGVPHIVAWPADERGDLTDRRHWHTACWQARERRRPTTQRPRGK